MLWRGRLFHCWGGWRGWGQEQQWRQAGGAGLLNRSTTGADSGRLTHSAWSRAEICSGEANFTWASVLACFLACLTCCYCFNLQFHVLMLFFWHLPQYFLICLYLFPIYFLFIFYLFPIYFLFMSYLCSIFVKWQWSLVYMYFIASLSPWNKCFKVENHCSLTIICCLEFQSIGTVGSPHEDSRGQDVGLLILWKEVHYKIFPEEAQKTPHRQDLDSHLWLESNILWQFRWNAYD